MEIKRFFFNPLRECCYVVWDSTLECVVIDPGCSSDAEFGRLTSFIEQNNLTPVKILLTHGHFDHIASAEDAALKWGVDVYINENDNEQISFGVEYGSRLGFSKPILPLSKQPVNISDNDLIKFGESELKVITTPGHTKGGVCFYSEKDKILFSGDTLFAGSIGRTDHIGGDYEQLIDSVVKKLITLPWDVEVLPGHGPTTDIGHEASSNPFLQPVDFQHITL